MTAMTLQSLLDRVGIEVDNKIITVAGQPAEGKGTPMAWPTKPTGFSWHTDKDGAEFVEAEGLGVFAVLSNEATPSKLTDAQGKPVLWPTIRKLTLGEDLVVYGCADCSYAHRSPDSIRPHRNKHRLAPARPDGQVTALLRSAIRQVAPDQAAKIEKLIAERDDWKRRALAAERRLSQLRQALTEEVKP